MTSFSRTAVTCVSAVLFAVASFAAKPDTDGAKVGVWTQDYDAAITLAKEKSLPVMLNFTGSDWCGWCKLMDKQVFSTDDWTKWATNNIVLVFLDFPQDRTSSPKSMSSGISSFQINTVFRAIPPMSSLTPPTAKPSTHSAPPARPRQKASLKTSKRFLFSVPASIFPSTFPQRN